MPGATIRPHILWSSSSAAALKFCCISTSVAAAATISIANQVLLQQLLARSNLVAYVLKQALTDAPLTLCATIRMLTYADVCTGVCPLAPGATMRPHTLEQQRLALKFPKQPLVIWCDPANELTYADVC
jgi:hypothetical protein